jgi:uncharacterized protein (DUF1800 family)
MPNMSLRFKIVIVPLVAVVIAGSSRPFAAGPAARDAQRSKNAISSVANDKTILHMLNRLGFGPTPAAIEHVRQMGVLAYIEEQLRPERIADTAMDARLENLTTVTKSTRELAETYFLPAMMERREQQRRAAQNPAAQDSGSAVANPPVRSPEQMQTQRFQRAPIIELSEQKLLRAAYSERQLEEVLVDFWFNHFNVFVGKGQVRLYLTEYERDVIRPHVLGRFRDLLGTTAHSPAMLFYLDNWQSTAAEGAPTSAESGARFRHDLANRRQPFGRPQFRRLPPDHLRPDQPQPPQTRRRGLNENYARELMELHTLGVDGGYTQKDVQEVARAFTGWTIDAPRQGGSFRFAPAVHDDGEKIVLGHRIKPGGGEKDGEKILDLLAKHPSTARFIATKLARRFVADDPPPPLVSRAADRFRQTDGDIREVMKTILTSPEFYANESYRAKVKSPFEFVVSAVRAANVEVTTAVPLIAALRDLGMPLYGAQPPTGYPDRADAWVNTGALLNRMNFAVSLTGGQMRGLRQSTASRGVASANVEETRKNLIATALADDVSASTIETVARAKTAAQAVALILGSPEFQKR